MTRDRDPATPLLLVRRAAVAGERDIAALLREVPLDAVEVAGLMRHHRVVVLSDLTLPPAAPPVAAAAFRLHRPAGTAQLAGIGVAVHLRGYRLAQGRAERARRCWPPSGSPQIAARVLRTAVPALCCRSKRALASGWLQRNDN